MPVELRGYSERGIVNALCIDIRYAQCNGIRDGPSSVDLLERFLGWCHFPFAEPAPVFGGIAEATLVVEQSFSDFGDLDLLILLDYRDGSKQAILVEAKVSTDTGHPTTIRGQWDDFHSYLGGDGRKASSLFVQLYRKLRLMEMVGNLDQILPPDAVARRWSLGNNRVVRQVAGILAQYQRDPWYLTIVFDQTEEVAQFFDEDLRTFNPAAFPYNLPNWNVSRWGFITWPELHDRVQQSPEDWPQMTENFAWNLHQIVLD